MTGKLTLSTQQGMGTFFELGKAKAAKGEGWAPPCISCAQDTVGLYLTAPMAIRLWETFTFLPNVLRMTKTLWSFVHLFILSAIGLRVIIDLCCLQITGTETIFLLVSKRPIKGKLQMYTFLDIHSF